jgi:hypothetical protein
MVAAPFAAPKFSAAVEDALTIRKNHEVNLKIRSYFPREKSQLQFNLQLNFINQDANLMV